MSQGNWQDKLSFVDKQGVEHEVSPGHTLTFYPVSLGQIMALRDIAKPFGKAMAILFTSTANDCATTERKFASDVAKGAFDSEVKAEAVTPELAKLRLESRTGAVDQVIEALFQPASLKAVGELVMDSLHDLFPRGDKNNPPALEFVNKIPAAVLLQMLVGVAKANKGMFGPLGVTVGKIAERLKGLVENRLNEQSPPANAPAQVNAQVPGAPNNPANWSPPPTETR